MTIFLSNARSKGKEGWMGGEARIGYRLVV